MAITALHPPLFRLIVGLGNPGDKYAGTRHNAGFDFIEALRRRVDLISETNKYSARMIQASVEDHKLLMLMPQTFMNLSGKSVLQAASFYKIKPEEILAVHDDVDLPPGKPRIKKGGGDGGHNGLKDITKMIGAQYYRLRLGVGRPADPRFNTADYVLGKFTSSETKELDTMSDFLAERIDMLLNPARHANLLSAYADYRNPRPPKPPRPATPPKSSQE